MSKPLKQIGALPLKWTKKGKLRVLLVTSRETKRWIMPKGWPMNGKKSWRAAEIEAFEEAGVTGLVSPISIGSFVYRKRLSSGKQVRCKVNVFPLHVRNELNSWPERKERRRKWVSPKRARRMVAEKELGDILKSVEKKRGSKAELEGAEEGVVGLRQGFVA